MSKITVAGVRALVEEVLIYANVQRKRNFVEAVEVQISLKGYDVHRDRRFSGAVRLPLPPRAPRVCLFGDQHDLDRAKHHGTDAISVDDLKKLNKNKKLVKKLARKYDAFIASDSLMRQIPRLLGPGLSRVGKFTTTISHADDFTSKVTDVTATIKFQLKKVLCLAVAVGNATMTTDELLANLILVTKSTMSPPRRLY
ncbi:60S ribosomal protein L10a [Podospora aff. communis PSN243]|uniref:60S ribosomal protein L10a n=1 Tax=Podospora aff. communis PSN243 TaxID=3040156 RepID=A0AAV9H3Y3_9PEZI|nr:60S ribosomal protein L10a [Podospora aff. communis PSN243]